MAGLDGTQALLIVLIILVFFLVFRRSERPRPDYPWRQRPGWWPERRALREYEERR